MASEITFAGLQISTRDLRTLVGETTGNESQGDDSDSTESYTWNSKMTAVTTSTTGDKGDKDRSYIVFGLVRGEFSGIIPTVPKRWPCYRE